jgi:hypothetical protein
VHEVLSFTLQSPGVFLHNTSVLTTIELVANPSFMSIFSCINTTLPNACTKMNLLYD